MQAYRYILQEAIPTASSHYQDSSSTQVHDDGPAPAELFPKSLDDFNTIFDPSNPTMDPSKPLHLEQPKTKGVAITGQPGIGKTVFGRLLLLLCLEKRQPVIMQTFDETIYAFDHDGVYEFQIADLQRQRWNFDRFPPHLWCLVDCGDDLLTVHPVFRTNFPFIIQTAPARDMHFKWINHMGLRPSRYPRQYYMAPWTLDELIIGLQNASERQLQTFHSTWGPSMGDAAMLAHSPQEQNELESLIKAKVRACIQDVQTFQAYLTIIRNATFPDKASH
ncbi:hypothetical protein OF83DRAFT_385201 [Amylostereum chailletii]|nr:hypothetical protein OF83DRAFT_385201 [Amylostereum chailletii]